MRCGWCHETGHNILTCEARILRGECIFHASVDKLVQFAASADRLVKTRKTFEKLKIRDLELLVCHLEVELEDNENNLINTGQYNEDEICAGWIRGREGCSMRLSMLFSRTNFTITDTERENLRNHPLYGHEMIRSRIFPGPPPKTIAKLNIHLERKDFNYELGEKCPICMCSVKQTNVVSLTCGHVMCDCCMVSLISSNLSNNCGLCRAPIHAVSILNKDGYDRLSKRFTFVGF
jgi:hypothetical protein